MMQRFQKIVLFRNGLQVDHGEVAALGEIAGLVQHIGDAAGHAGREITAGIADDDDDAAGHVFAAMVSDAFHDCDGAGIADGEALTGNAAEIAFALDRAVEHRVADDDGVFRRDFRRRFRRIDDHPPTRQALADIIVGVAFKFHGHAAGKPGTEALAGGAGQLDVDGIVGQALVAVMVSDLAGQHGAGRAVRVADRHLDPDRLSLVDRRRRFLNQLLVEDLVDMVVLLDGIVDLLRVVAVGFEEQPRKVQPVGLPVLDGGIAIQHLQLADHFVERPEAHFGHQGTGFLGDEEEIVDHRFRLSGKALAQHRVLGGDADRAGVQMALAHHDATGGDQRRSGEAELVGAE